MSRSAVKSRLLADQVIDALLADGGWLTTPGVALLLPECREQSIHHTLYQLRKKGWVEHRSRRLADEPNPPAEWRIHPDYEDTR